MVPSSWELLAIKLVSVPIFIWMVSTVARRWGHSIGGLILGLPLTSAPVLFFLSLEQGNAFASGAALGTLMGLVPFAASCLVFSLFSFRVGWPASLVACCLTFFAVAFILNYVSAPLLWSFVGVLAFLAIARSLFPSGPIERVSHKPPTWEIPARTIAATALVAGVWTVLGEDWQNVKYLSALFGIGAAVVFYLNLRRDKSALFALGVVVLTMMNPQVFFYSTQLYTETLSLFFLLTTLYLTKSERPLLWSLAGIAGALAFASRYPTILQVAVILLVESYAGLGFPARTSSPPISKNLFQ